ncbi:MAG: peptide chain release factor N(5)-glutamine methyltransferase [Deltaproteobacteria bacterium]|nr:MAG: peptide chain release factor N(5)-glutamine methyltransferase [Deltaproteobacteria bacterium]
MKRKIWTIKEILTVSSGYLKAKGIDSPRLTAEILLAHVLGVNRVSLYLDFDKPLIENEVSRYRELIRRRMQREPVQYITGKQEFWSLEFHVDPRVLIPRPETELLVEHTISIAKEHGTHEKSLLRILDLCTGCGAIAIALAKELPKARLWLTDISHGALDVALENATKHNVEQRITFLQGDLWEPLSGQSHEFDVIVSNPPYVTSDEYEALPPEIRNHEPKIALDAGPDGMRFLERIIKGAPSYLCPGGWLLVEMDPRQIDKAVDLVQQTGMYQRWRKEKDYSNSYRVLISQKAL